MTYFELQICLISWLTPCSPNYYTVFSYNINIFFNYVIILNSRSVCVLLLWETSYMTIFRAHWLQRVCQATEVHLGSWPLTTFFRMVQSRTTRFVCPREKNTLLNCLGKTLLKKGTDLCKLLHFARGCFTFHVYGDRWGASLYQPSSSRSLVNIS